MALSVGNHVGRLLEVRVVPPVTLEETTRFLQEIVRLTAAQPAKIVACTDLRGGARATDPEMIDFIARRARAAAHVPRRARRAAADGALRRCVSGTARPAAVNRRPHRRANAAAAAEIDAAWGVLSQPACALRSCMCSSPRSR